MPNWCTNHMHVKGPLDAVTSFARQHAEPASIIGDLIAAAEAISDEASVVGAITHSLIDGLDEDSYGSLFSFDRAVPEPTTPDAHDWYAWRLKHWGTKWNARLTRLSLSADSGDYVLTYTFDTAWAPPASWLYQVTETLRANTSPLRVELTWYEEGGEWGSFDAVPHELIEADETTSRARMEALGFEMADVEW